MRSRLPLLFGAISVAGSAWGAAIAVAGGVNLRLGPVALRARRPLDGFAVAILALAAATVLLVLGHRRGQRTPAANVAGSADGIALRWIAAAAAVLLALAGMTWGTWVAGGSDSQGYVSQARLLVGGRVTVYEPLALDAPWPEAIWAFTPLGYKPGHEPGSIAPYYPPGLPLVMAVAQLAAGPWAVYLVVPIFGAAGVWCAYLIGRRLHSPAAGAIAAVWLAASPIVEYQVVQPMSDVPAAAWVAAAFVAATSFTTLGAAGAGLALGAAVATRPNLALVAIPLGLVAWMGASGPAGPRRAAWSRVVAFAAGCAPGAVTLAVLQWIEFGSPVRTGYPPFGAMFRFEHFLPDVARYPAWLLASETPLILLALAAPWVSPLVVGSRHGQGREETGSRRIAWAALATAGLVLVPYLFYTPFDDPSFVRFLLPALPLIVALASAVLAAAARRLPHEIRLPSLVLGCSLLVAVNAFHAQEAGVFRLRDLDRRYETAGNWVAAHLPPRAAVLTVQHSGSVRFYSDRLTVRWDAIPPAWFDRAVAFLAARGRPPYLLLEESEIDQFQRRFRDDSVAVARFAWPAVGGVGVVRVYDLTPAGR